MKNQDAKFILSGYRPGGQDASDPTFAEALQQAKRDPELGRWFAEQQAHAAAVAAKLKEISPPAQLRAAVLAGSSLTQPATPGWRWLRPALGGFAAALLLVAGVVTVLPAKPVMDVAQLTAFAIKDAQNFPHARPVGTAANDLKALLEQDGVCLATGLHFDFETLRTTGCRTLTDDGHELVEICFRRDGDFYHFYVVKRSDFANLKPATFSGPKTEDGVSFVSWADQNYFYMVASRATPEVLAKLL
jgi:hypothetical protein